MKVSIITPSYNQGQFLEATINSVANQNYRNIEHIVIDGGSSDNSREILEQYSDQLAYWISEKDNGQTDAINKGLRKATGDIITWINSDDQLMPKAVENAVKHFEQYPDIGLIHGKTILFDLNGKETLQEGQADGLPYRYLAGMCFPQPSSFFRKSVLDEIGFPDEAYHYGMDYDLFARAYLHFDFLKVDDVFSKYLLHDESKTVSSSVDFADDWAKVFSKVLRSIEGTKQLIDQLKELALYKEGDDTFKVRKSIDIEFLKASLKYHLGYQMYFRYEGYDLQGVKRIGTFVRSEFPEYYKAAQLDQMHQRAKMPAWLLKTIKKIKGS